MFSVSVIIVILLIVCTEARSRKMSLLTKPNSLEGGYDSNGSPYDTPTRSLSIDGVASTNSRSNVPTTSTRSENFNVLFGVPRQLFPVYCAFVLDAMAVGLVMPLLPFFAMQLGANAFQLSLVVSSNYLAQMIGCVIMGLVSDAFGRRIVLLICLAASSLQYFCASYTSTLLQLSLARIISGMFGGLLPVMQSCVADVVPESDRPKYLGRITASFGLGFVLGPLLNSLLTTFEIRDKIRLACSLPFFGFIFTLIFFRETNVNIRDKTKRANALPQLKRRNILGLFTTPKKTSSSSAISEKAEFENNSIVKGKLKMEVWLLILNGFLLMYAFATETIYAMFIKDTFGMGEQALSMLFACNGLAIGIFQVLFIKPLIAKIGKHATLAFGNSVLAIGMIGVALIRRKYLHFSIFALHVIGYSIADTALSSLVTRYSPSEAQGRALSFNQAAQACARVVSPLIAGLLYESKFGQRSIGLPSGSLPFLFGALFPAAGVSIPFLLYSWSMDRQKLKLRARSQDDDEERLLHVSDSL